MIKAERAKLVSKILNEYYPETPVPLEHSSVYTLLIAVLLSAQCTDERVNKVTPYLFKLASSPESMSKISQQKIYEIIKPCGLGCLLYTSPSPRDRTRSRMPSSA